MAMGPKQEEMTMDPKACLIWAAEAIQANDLETANDHLDDYADWRMNRKGFEPTIHGADVWNTGLIGSKNMTFDGDSFYLFLSEIL